MNNKGFILIQSLFFLFLFTAIFSQQLEAKILLYQIKMNESYIKERQILESYIMNYILEKFVAFKEETISMEINDSTVSISYDDLIAYVDVAGKFNFKSKITYDDFCECITNYEYRGDSIEE